MTSWGVLKCQGGEEVRGDEKQRRKEIRREIKDKHPH